MFSTPELITLIKREQFNYIIKKHVNNISAGEWIDAKCDKEWDYTCEKFYWEQVSSGYIDEDVIFHVEICMIYLDK